MIIRCSGVTRLRRRWPGTIWAIRSSGIRITLQPLSIDDISKLWAGFQMQYRLSVAYEVAVVLIDSTRPTRAAPPVLHARTWWPGV